MKGKIHYENLVFRAPDEEQAFTVAVIFCFFGHAQTKIWNATEWSRFKDLIKDVSVGG